MLTGFAAGATMAGASLAAPFLNNYFAKSSAKKSMKYQLELMKQQDKYHDENMYSDPLRFISGQVSGLERNGINKILATGSIGGGSAGFSPSSSFSVATPQADLTGVGESVGKGLTAMLEKQEVKNKVKEGELLDAQKDKVHSDIQSNQANIEKANADASKANVESAVLGNDLRVQEVKNGAWLEAVTGKHHLDSDGNKGRTIHGYENGNILHSNGRPAFGYNPAGYNTLVDNVLQQLNLDNYNSSLTRAVLKDIGSTVKGAAESALPASKAMRLIRGGR